MSTMNDPAFDFEAFFDNITDFPPEETEVVQNKLQEKEKWNLLRKKIVKVHVAISKSNKIRSELAEKEKELANLRNNNKDILVKYLPLEKKYSELVAEFSKVKVEYAQNEAELEASQCHLKQLQALVKILETKLEANSLEKSLLNKETIDDQTTRKKHIKHLIMFGKLAACQNKLSSNHLKILNKYLRQVGENSYESDKDIDTIAMPPSCSSVDTGIGSSLAQSEDEKIWSPDSQFSQSVTYEAVTVDNNSCSVDTTRTSNTNSALAFVPDQLENTFSVLEDACDPTVRSVFDVNSNANSNEETTVKENIFELNLQETKSKVSDTAKTSERLPKSPIKAIPLTLKACKQKGKVTAVRVNTVTSEKMNCSTSPRFTGMITEIPATKTSERLPKSPIKAILAPNPLTPKASKQKCKITSVRMNKVTAEKANSATSPRFTANNLLDTTTGIQEAGCKKKSLPVGPKQKSERKSRIIDMLFDHTDKSVENNTSKLSEVNCDEMSSDSEVENILKEMNISSLRILSPMPPTPLNVQQALKKNFLRTQQCSNVKKPCKRLNNAKSLFSQKIRKLQLTNYKLNKVICRQRRQLLTANRIILKSNKNILGSTEDDFVRLLSLMSKVGSRFNIEEKKNDELTAHKFPICKENILEKISCFIKENANTKECNGKLDKQSQINHSKILKTSESTKDKTKINTPSNINNERGEDTTKMILQDKEISSADCVSQQHLTDRNCFIETESGRSSPAFGENHEEMEMKHKKGPKRSKLSKLEKLKLKLKRKPKIDVEVPPVKKNCKGMDVTHSISIPTNNEIKSSIELNNRTAYEKAVRVMSELKVKNHNKNGSFQDNAPRLTRSSFKIRRNSKSSSLLLDTDHLHIKDAEVAHTDDELNAGDIQQKTISASHNIKKVEKEPDMAGERENVRSLRSKTRKSTQSNQLLTGNINEIQRTMHSDTFLNKKLKGHKDLDAVDQPGKESRKDQLDYNDLAMFGNDENPHKESRKDQLDYNDLAMFGNDEDPHKESRKDQLDYNDLAMFGNDEKPKNNTSIASLGPQSNEQPMCTIVMNEKKKTKIIGGKKVLNNCNDSNVSERVRQLRSRLTSPEKYQDPGNSLPITPLTVHLLDKPSENVSCSQGCSSLNPQLKSPPGTRSIMSEQTGLMDRIYNTTGNIITTEENFQHQTKLNYLPNESLENETYLLSDDLKQVDGICNDSTGKSVIIDENKHQHFFKSMLAKYGVKISRKLLPPNIPENITKDICMQMEDCLGEIVDAMPTQIELDALVARLETKNRKFFIVALLEFLTSDQRSKDILCKAYTPPLPPMTKSEQALLYILSALQKKWSSIDLFNEIMKNIEYKLFRLGHTPLVAQVENLSHFYAVLCRFRKSLSRLRLFMVDAMYCMNFKAIPLIKQCIDVWMHVLPLSHMRSAKNPLVLAIVYLVFYFHSNDPNIRNTKDVDYLKYTLTKKYSFLIENFTQQIIINKLRECIVDLPAKKKEGWKVLSTALILLTKRNGVKWCQKTIVDGMLIPLIKSKTTPEPSKVFCISVLGSLLKPYPDNMKLHCEMAVNQLLLLMEQHPSFVIEQAILISLILLRRHNRLRPLEILQSWKPRGKISRELEDQIKVLIQEQPLKHWIKFLCDKSSL